MYLANGVTRDRHRAGPPGPAILETRFSEPGNFEPGSSPKISSPGFFSQAVLSLEPGLILFDDTMVNSLIKYFSSNLRKNHSGSTFVIIYILNNINH